MRWRFPPARRWCAIESNLTALLRGAAVFVPGYECKAPIAPTDFDRRVSRYCLTQTALLRNLYPGSIRSIY